MVCHRRGGAYHRVCRRPDCGLALLPGSTQRRRRAATANEQADANQVSYWAPNSNAIVVQNLGQDPVYDVTLTFGEFATTANAPVQEITNGDYSAQVGTLPPCKVATINTKILLTTSAEDLQLQAAAVVETKAGAAGQAGGNAQVRSSVLQVARRAGTGVIPRACPVNLRERRCGSPGSWRRN